MLQLPLPSHLIRAGDHQVPFGMPRQHFGKGFNQQIAALLGMNSPHKKRQLLSPQCRISSEELIEFDLRFPRGYGRTIVDHNFIAAIQPEGLASQNALLLTSKKHGLGVTQYTILRPRPIHPFFKMLERISAFEPGIEHAVREQHVGCVGIVQSPPGSKAVKLPDSVHDDGIVPATVLSKPGKKPRTEGIPERGWA